MTIVWMIFSYLLGSVPFGYLISRFSGKNILEIGWKKNSGSNVFKNVGKWQGILTVLFDLAKGYLAVYGAQAMGFPSEVQAFSGTAAVIGHNWSIFLRFAGGRGIGTLVGAFLALAPQVLLFSLLPLVLLALIWNAAIGTLLFLATAFFLSFYFNQLETAGFLTIFSLGPILIKRLSPLQEIRKSEKKINLIANRLFFDNNEALWDFRLKRILLKKKNNPGRLVKLAAPLSYPLVYPSKLGWRAAKYGVKMAKKPIAKFILKTPEKVVTEIKVEDFKKMMIAAAAKVVFHQEEINRINVFPVADKDTGYNLAATLLGVEGTISQKDYSSFRELTQDIKEAAMINARGNAGMIYTGYVIEVLDRIKHLETIDAFHLALAMKKGVKAARDSVVEPVEGTILDVIKTAGYQFFESVKRKKEKNIIKLLEEAYKKSLLVLKETKEKLPVLKENDVVDAGALGFVKILEAWLESLKGVAQINKKESVFSAVQPKAKEELEYRYEVVSIFRKTSNLNLETFKKELTSLGDSLEVLETESRIKIHIHTNQPELLQEKLKNLPEAELRIEDMQFNGEKIKKEPLGLVVDEVADLPQEFLEKNRIIEVPFTTRFSTGEVFSAKEEIYEKMEEALKAGRSLPTTSAPTFQDFIFAFEKALERFEKILVITISSKLSGSYSSARIARSTYQKPTKLNIHVFDCNTAEVAEGLVVLKANELISQGKKIEEILEVLKNFCPQVNLIACFADFRYVVKGGRLKLPALLVKPFSFFQKIGLRFLVGLRNGRVKFFRAAWGKEVAEILAKEIDRQRQGRKIKIAIAHADNQVAAEKLKSFLQEKPGIEVAFVSAVSSVVATHTGPGLLVAAFHPVDVEN